MDGERYSEGDFCPSRGCTGTLERMHQTSTVPAYAFSYLACSDCSWSNWRRQHPDSYYDPLWTQ